MSSALRRSASCLALLGAASLAYAEGPPPVIRQLGTARLEGVPEISPRIAAAVQRYHNARGAVFQDWLPDGSMLIATRFGSTQQLHRVTAPGGARTQLTFFDEPVAAALAIPGTQRFVFLRDRGGDEWFQLYAMGLTGEPTLLTEPGTRNQAPVVSRDGKLIVWSRSQKASSEYSILAADPRDPKSVRVVHRAAGSIEPVDLAEDGTQALLIRRLSNRESQLWRLDLASGKTARLAPEAGPVLYSDAKLARGARSLLAISDDGSDVRRLLEIDLETGSQRALTPASRWDVERFALSEDGRLLAYATNEDGLSRVTVMDVAARRALPQPETLRGVITALRFSPDGARLALSLSAAKTAGDVWSWSVDGGELTRWTTSELGGLEPSELVEPELVRFPSFDGLAIPAFVYRPARAAPATRTPVIIDVHGGPEAQSRPGWNVGAQYFAGVLGASVVLPNVRGGAGYGKRYLDLDNAERREDSVKDIGALLGWIAAQPGLDAERVAVYGGSYGGYMALAAMTHYSDRLVGGVELFGISDFASFLRNTESYRRDIRRAEYGDERDPRMRALFERISPLANVAKIKKPLLVLQGANDPRVAMSESDQLVAGVRENGVEAWYVVFSDEGHGFRKKPNNDLRRAVETRFLAQRFGIALE